MILRFVPNLRKRARMLRGSACYQTRIGWARHLVDDIPRFMFKTAEEVLAYAMLIEPLARPIDVTGRMDAASLKRFRTAVGTEQR
jgi:hypothetical protein